MTVPSAVLVALVAFVLMEPVTAATHRFVMHGIGRRLHRSHHSPTGARFERNDWFPVMFASIVMLGMWAGFNLDGLEVLVPVGVGVTLYGVVYALVHDGWIHRRVGWFDEPATWRRSTGWPRPTGSIIDTTARRSACSLPIVPRRRFAIGRWIATTPLLDSDRSQREEAIASGPHRLVA